MSFSCVTAAYEKADSDIDILCCHSAGGVDILIKSPDILFPTVLWDIYVLWKKKKKSAHANISV